MTDFYSALAEDYDGMTQFESRLPKVRSSLVAGLMGKSPKTALDVACGTGVCALALAQLGLSVVGTDPNEDMVRKAEENAASLAVSNVRFQVAFMQDDLVGMPPVDLITCLGNSIPHVSRDDLPRVAERFRANLKNGGEAVIQLKNFVRILNEGNRFVGAGRSGDKELIRFYDLTEDTVSFNILRLTWDGDRASPEWIQTDMTPFAGTDLEKAFLAAGFSSVEFYATIRRDPFDVSSSSDLVVIATA
jgi:glycine/sarcosine N-methyltransferase